MGLPTCHASKAAVLSCCTGSQQPHSQPPAVAQPTHLRLHEHGKGARRDVLVHLPLVAAAQGEQGSGVGPHHAANEPPQRGGASCRAETQGSCWSMSPASARTQQGSRPPCPILHSRLSYRQLLRRQRKLLDLGRAARDEVAGRQLAPLRQCEVGFDVGASTHKPQMACHSSRRSGSSHHHHHSTQL